MATVRLLVESSRCDSEPNQVNTPSGVLPLHPAYRTSYPRLQAFGLPTKEVKPPLHFLLPLLW